MHTKSSTRIIAQRSAFASATERKRLRLGLFKRVFRLSRLRYEDGRPHSLERIVFPISRLPGLDRHFASTRSLPEIADRYGHTLSKASERVRNLRPPSDVAVHLSIADTQSVMELDRVVFTADGVPIAWRITFMPL